MRRAEYTIFDLEWTTTKSRKSYIIEIGAVRVKDGNIVGEFNKLLKYSDTISPVVKEITGITEEMLESGENRENALLEFWLFSENSILVAHDIQNDMKILREEYFRLGLEIDRRELCTFKLSKKAFSSIEKYNLTSVAEFLGVERERQHRALSDALVSYEILKEIFNIVPESIDSLDKLKNWREVKRFLIREEIEGIELNTAEEYRGFFDGASSGNPGKMGIGFALLDNNNRVIYEGSKYIGVGTNNEAEYVALISLLQLAFKSGIRKISVYGDSKLVVQHLKGEWRVKAENLKPLFREAKDLIEKIPNISVEWVKRDENKIADALSKMGVESGSK